MNTYDAMVLGTGGVGSAALYELARRGVRAVGIDRWHPPHDRGSTHGQTRAIRQAYFEHPDYVPLVQEAYRLWHDLESRTGRHLFNEVGILEIGPPDGVVVPGVLRAAEQHQLGSEQLTAPEIERHWPGFRIPRELVGVFDPRAGYLLVEDCVQAHLDAAQAAGAELLTDVEVQGWTADDREVRVETSAGPVAAGCLIVTAGAWASRLLADLSVPLTVRRKSLFWFDAPTADYDVAGLRRAQPSRGFPVYLFELPHGVFYGFPKLEARGVKIAEHSGGRTVDDPLTVDRSIDAEEQRRLADVLAAHLPGVSSRVTDHVVCLYTMTPDEHFLVDRHPAHGNVVFAAGLSGHGFKFTSVLGHVLADLAVDGATDLPIDFLSLGRFS
jgi:monomeric sarcosine oxidase